MVYFIANIKDNIWALLICIPGLDIDSAGLKIIESDVDVYALYNLAEKHVTVDLSPPLKSRPFRNDMKGRVLFTDMYCAKYEGFKMYPLLNEDEGNNDASKSVDVTQGVQGAVDGITGGMNDGMDVANIDIDEQVLAKQKKLYKGKSKMTDDDIVTSKKRKVASRGNDKSFDYLSNGEDELIEHRRRMIQFKVNGVEVPDEVPFYEVPREFGNEERSVEVEHTTIDVDRLGEIDDSGVGLTPLIREHEKYMQALLRKLKAWREFPNVDKFKECLTFYAVANGFSLWFERSNKEKIVAKCGQRKEIIKDPSK
ncbi:pentatricopeptide repeat-containing protein, partial [Tanacetum coccineum]